MNIKLSSRYREIQKQYDLLIFGNIFYSILCWFGLIAFLSKEDFTFWVSGVVLMTVGVVLYLTFTLLKNKLLTPFQFHLSVFILSIPNGLLLLDASLRLMVYSTNLQVLYASLLIISNILFTIGGVVVQTIAFREGLKDAISQNIGSGRLDIKEGFWDLSAPIYFDSKESENKKSENLKRLSRLSPIITTITFIFARILEGETKVMVAAIVIFLMSTSYIWGYARHLAVAIQIKEWQRIYKVKISLQ